MAAEGNLDVAQAWDDLLTAARDAGYAVTELVRPPATAEQLRAAETAIGRKLPADLAALYLLSDGQEHEEWPLFGAGWAFDSLETLQVEYRSWAQIREQYTPEQLTEDFDSVIDLRGDDPVQQIYTNADWIPFATDGGGNSLAADLAPQPGGNAGQVIVIGPDEDERRVLAPSVTALLRLCASRIGDQPYVLEP